MTTTRAYSSHATNWPAVAVAVLLALPLAALSQESLADHLSGCGIVALLLVLGVACVGALTATSLRVTVGPGGVVARFGVLGVPTFRYGADRIASAQETAISPWATPGVFWTRREGLRLALRGGPALRLVLRDGRRVTIAVPDARAALDALAQVGSAKTGDGDT